MHKIATQQVLKKKKKSFKSRQATKKHYQEDNKEKEYHKCIEDSIIITKPSQVRKNIPVKTDATNVVTPHRWRDLDVQPVDINVRTATSLVILVACATRKKESEYKRESRKSRAHQLMVRRA